MTRTRIYTRTGDTGETGLFGGGRVSKAHARVEAYGAVDELNAALGGVLALLDADTTRDRLAAVQPDLFAIGAHLATPAQPRAAAAARMPALPAARNEEMERWIDEAEEELPALRAFIMPGGAPAGAALHFARTVCRRAERRVIAFGAQDDVDPSIVRYLNRLSDLLFVYARLSNAHAGSTETEWTPAP